MTASEFYTRQFYAWEKRGRGWGLAEIQIQLEPPFVPFFFHGYRTNYVDDGRRPTLFNRLVESFAPKKALPLERPVIEYETIEPFAYDETVNLQAVQVHFPPDRTITPEKMKAVLILLSQSKSNISFEIIGTQQQIIIQFVADIHDMSAIETSISAYLPECTLVKNNTFREGIFNPRSEYSAAVDFGLAQELYRPIHMVDSFGIDPLAPVCRILEQLNSDQQAGIQILFKGVESNWTHSIRQSVSTSDSSSFFTNEPNAPKIAQLKTQSPFFAVTIRAYSQANTQHSVKDTLVLLAQAINQSTQSSTNYIATLDSPTYTFSDRCDDIYFRGSRRLGMLLNVDELCTLLHFPSQSVHAKKLFISTRKTVETPLNAINKQFVLGENYHNGEKTKVSISVEDRLKHTQILGATGTGKSTLIANLIIQDIAHDFGVILFDPHGDLIEDVIPLIPKHRRNDVVLIDPSDKEYSIGLNILQAHSDLEKEVLSSDLVASFRKHATSWGDQMNSVLGNAILAILEHPQGGSLQDLRRFLIESDFRTKWLTDISDSYITYYWYKEYPLLKTSSIGSILTRLDTFLRSKNIRDMVSQRKGLDLEKLMDSKKIILLKLSQGLIGKENSYLLGSLFLSKIHQAILQRQQSTQRSPVALYLDEFQNFITPSIKEMLSGIRKYRVGLTISHQDLHQLQHEDSELLNSVLGNISNRIVFRVGEPDAKRLQDGFSHFTFSDFQNLGKGEAIVRIEQPQYDCSLTTLPLPKVSEEEKTHAIDFVQTHSRSLYASKRTEIETMQVNIGNLIPSKPTQEHNVKQTIVEEPLPKIQEVVQPLQSQESIPNSVHRYLQSLVKKMAEQRGYVANIETLVPDGTGQVDILLSKDKKTIAVEICNTTNAEWEMHNISKCISAKYDSIVSLSGDSKQLEKIRKKCESEIPNFSAYTVHFFTPDALFVYLDESTPTHQPLQDNVVKGYRVNVSYSSQSQKDSERKQMSVANIVLNSIKKQRK